MDNKLFAIGILLLLFSLTSMVGASLTYDTSGSNVCGPSSCSKAITTSDYDDVLVAVCGGINAGGSMSASDTAGLTWIPRGQVTPYTYNMFVFYAISPGKLTADSVKCTQTGISGNLAVHVFAVNGVNTITPFDPNVKLPSTNSVSSVASVNCFETTSNPNDYLFTATVRQGIAVSSLPAGFIQTTSSAGSPSETTANDIVSSTQSAVPETWTLASSASGISAYCDALQAANLVGFSAISSNSVANPQQYELLTINLNGGGGPYSYNFLVTNSYTSNIIFSSIVSNAITSNSVSFALPTIAVNPNAIGPLTFTANVVDSFGSNILISNTITVKGIITPSNIIAYLPITFTNYQTTAIPANTPLPVGINTITTVGTNVIGFNALAYSKYYTCNLNNAEFFFQNGTIVSSWLEGNLLNEQWANSICTDTSSSNSLINSANVLYWVLDPDKNFLTANAGVTPITNTIYLGWSGNIISTSNTLFSNTIGSPGEAPQLSCSNPYKTQGASCSTYGEYDTGNAVFAATNNGFYSNFTGTSLPSKWVFATGGAGTATQNNGLLINQGASSHANFYTTFYPPASGNFVLDAYTQNVACGNAYGFSFGNTIPAAASGGYTTNGVLTLAGFGNCAGAPAIDRYLNNVQTVDTAATQVGGFAANSFYTISMAMVGNTAIASTYNSYANPGSSSAWGSLSVTDTSIPPMRSTTSNVVLCCWRSSVIFFYQWVRIRDVSPAGVNPATNILINPATSYGTVNTIGTATPLSTPSISFSNTLLDSGQVETITGNWLNGVSTFTVKFFNVTGGATFNTLAGVSASPATNTFIVSSPTSNNAFSWNVIVTDSGSTTSNSLTSVFGVNTALTGTPAISPSTPSIDNGQSITLASSGVSGGTSPYTYNWFTGTACQTLISGQTASSITVSPGSTTGYSVNVIDSATTPENSICSAIDTVTVNTKPSVSFTMNTLLDSGQKQVINAMLSGGTGAFTVNDFNVTGSSTFNSVAGIGVGGSSSNSFITSAISSTPYSWNIIAVDKGVSSSSSPYPYIFNSVTQIFGVNAVLASGSITPVSPSIDNGQSITLTSSWTGGTSNYAVTWYDGNSASCASDTNSIVTHSGISGLSDTLSVSPTTGTKYYCSVITDSATLPVSVTDGADLVTISAALQYPSLSGNTLLDSGQLQILSTSWGAGGSGAIKVSFYNETGSLTFNTVPSATSPTTNTFTVLATTQTSYTWNSLIRDSAFSPVTHNSIDFVFGVNAVLAAGSITPASPSIDNGQSITLTSSWTGGTSTYSVTWYDGNSASCSSDTNTIVTHSGISGLSDTLSVSPATGTKYYCSVIADSATLPTSVTDAADSVTVSSALGTQTGLTGNLLLDSGQKQILSATWSGGTPNYKVQFYNETGVLTFNTLANVATSPSTNTFVTSAIGQTKYTWNSIVTDSAYSPVTRNSIDFVFGVNAILAAGTLTPASPTIDSGQSIVLTAAWSGGTSTYSVTWYDGNSAVCSSDTNSIVTHISLSGLSDTLSVSPTADKHYCAVVADSATLPASVTLPSDLVSVSSALSSLAVTGNALLDSGQIEILTGSWSGGTPNYKVVFYNATGGTAFNTLGGVATSPVTNTFTVFSPTNGNVFTANLIVTDSASTPITVNSVGAGNFLFTVNALLSSTLTASNSIADRGQAETLTYAVTGGTLPYFFNVMVSNALTGNIIAQNLGGSVTSGTNTLTFIIPTAAQNANAIGTITISGNVVDSATLASNLLKTSTINIKAQPSITLTITNALVDSGQTQTLKAQLNAGGGAGTFTVSFFNVTGGSTFNTVSGAAIGSLTTNSFIVSTPTSGNTFNWNVIVADAGTTSPYIFNTVTSSFTANAAFSLIAKSASNSIASQGQSELLTISVSGGTLPYSYNFMVSNTNTGNVIFSSIVSNALTTNTVSFMLPVEANDIGSVTFTANVLDDATAPANVLGIATITVNNPTTSLSGPSNAIADVGQYENFVATAVSDNFPFTYNFLVSNSVTAAVTLNALFVGAIPATYPFNYVVTNADAANSPEQANVTVTDSHATTANSVYTSTFVINPPLSVGAITGASTINAGDSVTLTATPSGGSLPYSYQWYSGSSATCSSDSLVVGANSVTYTDQPGFDTYYCVQVTDSATTHVSGTTSSFLVTVNPVHHGGGGGGGGGSSNTTSVKPQLIYLQLPLFSSVVAGINSSSTLQIKNALNVPVIVNISTTGQFSRLLSFSATSFIVPANQSLLAEASFNASGAQPGVYTIPVSVLAKTFGGATTNSTQYLTYSVASLSRQVNLVSQISSSVQNATVSLMLLGQKNGTIRNATLQTFLPPYLVNNVSQIMLHGALGNVSFMSGIAGISWFIPYLSPGSTISLSYQITNPADFARLTQIQNLFVAPSSAATSKILKATSIQVPTFYTNSTNQISAQVLYTGSTQQNVTFALTSQGNLGIRNPTQTVMATPGQLVGSTFNVTTGSAIGTAIMTLSISTYNASLNYTIPVLIQQKQAGPSTQTTTIGQIVINTSELNQDAVIAISIIIAVGALVYAYIRMPKRPKYNQARAKSLENIREQIRRSDRSGEESE